MEAGRATMIREQSQSRRSGARVVGVCMWLLLAVVVSGVPRGPQQVQAEEFLRAGAHHTWQFPRDHGQHSLYETEWWYYTGQVYDQESEPFKDKPKLGFQLTFFRKSIRSSHGIDNDYMAHAAITDCAAGKTIFESRLGGGAIGLSRVSDTSLRSWSGDWTVDPIGNDLFLRFSVRDSSTQATRHLRIQLEGISHPWLQGQGGVSKKAECEGCASMYYTVPRITLKAQYIDGERESVLHGIGWMDHEFMTNSLASGQVGWDWMGLMLRDGRNLMLFRVRSQDVTSKDYLAGGVYSASGVGRSLTAEDFSVTPLEIWTSPRTGARYPIAWRVQVRPSNADDKIEITVRARVPDCEIGAATEVQKSGTGVTYWEGPVANADESATGYLEMTGYAGKLSL